MCMWEGGGEREWSSSPPSVDKNAAQYSVVVYAHDGYSSRSGLIQNLLRLVYWRKT